MPSTGQFEVSTYIRECAPLRAVESCFLVMAQPHPERLRIKMCEFGGFLLSTETKSGSLPLTPPKPRKVWLLSSKPAEKWQQQGHLRSGKSFAGQVVEWKMKVSWPLSGVGCGHAGLLAPSHPFDGSGCQRVRVQFENSWKNAERWLLFVRNICISSFSFLDLFYVLCWALQTQDIVRFLKTPGRVKCDVISEAC